MFAKQKTPYDVIFQAYFENLRKFSDRKKILTKLEKLFVACNENNFILSENSILELQKLLNFSGFTFSDSLVNNNGCCNKCGQKLKKLELIEDEFENLKKQFFEEVIIGKNIFNKTNPAELSEFQEFLKSTKGYNVVIDGLNVAYIAGTKQSPEVYSTLLAKVVSHFVEENKKVIVLGRKHMKSWPQKQWRFISSNALVFLTQNISLDDPYLLYCALHCGKDAILVSRDLMRSHLFALKDPKNKIRFTRWLEQRQFQVTHVRNDGKVLFKNPRPYTRIVQHDNNNWHIPFIVAPEENEEPDKIPEKWLCMQKS
ncbi:mitochondrial ribonuclease P catalytic subunit isoform X2 [Coccinella septempunctata]|nr:mitochondrial ribonuclease P catalytic subunit isoform X2 [Coccinella septempunctata]